MALDIVFIIIIVVIALIIGWAIFKRVFKLFIYAGLIIALLLALNIYFVYKDAADLREHFTTSTKKVILVDDDKVLTGFLLDRNINFIADDELSRLSSSLAEGNYEELLGDSYKLMVFDVDIISDIDEQIVVEDEPISNEDAISFLKSGERSTVEKSYLFADILTYNILSSNNPLFFFSEFKKGNIMIYPETALFKTIKFIPTTFIKNIGQKVLYTTTEKARSFVVEEEQ